MGRQFNILELEVLELAVEDWHGLWELPTDQLEAVQAVVREFMADGLVEVATSEWPPRAFSVLDDNNALAMLANAANWRWPDENGTNPLVWVGATKAGRDQHENRCRMNEGQ